jgi:chromosome segregation ATPase
MARNVSGEKFKRMKQEYRDEISSLRQQLRALQSKPAPAAPKPVGITDEAKAYRAQTQSMLSQAEQIRSGYSAQLASIAERQKIYDQTMASRSAALTRQGEEQMAALRSQSAAERETAAQEAAVRSANQRRAELAPRLQIQPAGETPTTGGTQPFKRRRQQFGDTKPYGGLAINSQTLNV